MLKSVHHQLIFSLHDACEMYMDISYLLGNHVCDTCFAGKARNSLIALATEPVTTWMKKGVGHVFNVPAINFSTTEVVKLVQEAQVLTPFVPCPL